MNARTAIIEYTVGAYWEDILRGTAAPFVPILCETRQRDKSDHTSQHGYQATYDSFESTRICRQTNFRPEAALPATRMFFARSTKLPYSR